MMFEEAVQNGCREWLSHIPDETLALRVMRIATTSYKNSLITYTNLLNEVTKRRICYFPLVFSNL